MVRKVGITNNLAPLICTLIGWTLLDILLEPCFLSSHIGICYDDFTAILRYNLLSWTSTKTKLSNSSLDLL